MDGFLSRCLATGQLAWSLLTFIGDMAIAAVLSSPATPDHDTSLEMPDDGAQDGSGLRRGRRMRQDTLVAHDDVTDKRGEYSYPCLPLDASS